MASIFPFTNPATFEAETDTTLPLYYDVEWDFAKVEDVPAYNAPLYYGGEPHIVSGLPAVKSWAWRALHTERFLNEVYSWNYGNEMMSVIGEMWDEGVKIAELSRYCRECLMASPYITAVRDISITFESKEARVYMSCRVDTLYGTDSLEVVI